MTHRIDLEPAGTTLLTILAGVRDEHLDRPTPYHDRTVGELLQHLVTVTRVLRATAEKDFGPLTEVNLHVNDWPGLEDGWRAAIEEQVPQLVQAWREESAWGGTTRGGGLEGPAETAGRITLDELVLHGWDLARATGQDYPIDSIDPEVFAASLEFLEAVEHDEVPEGQPAAGADDDVSVFNRMVALSGRDPQWSPS
ncbi:TIGR03086 family protein [Aeromicrobium flavum]|uniref:TIGR03086 family protein n=1 Tax=Aeromicrobium flavum TaxID=416568 RepID=A0A512HVF6_9ACTN|nr:TIGR03086 family metal-binding protein [Aeromicrobium flavum]GEO89415.1 TIGR03086 family protein [Aeromicrobium flavum]